MRHRTLGSDAGRCLATPNTSDTGCRDTGPPYGRAVRGSDDIGSQDLPRGRDVSVRDQGGRSFGLIPIEPSGPMGPVRSAMRLRLFQGQPPVDNATPTRRAVEPNNAIGHGLAPFYVEGNCRAEDGDERDEEVNHSADPRMTVHTIACIWQGVTPRERAAERYAAATAAYTPARFRIRAFSSASSSRNR